VRIEITTSGGHEAKHASNDYSEVIDKILVMQRTSNSVLARSREMGPAQISGKRVTGNHKTSRFWLSALT
jgi:hypothetical protein